MEIRWKRIVPLALACGLVACAVVAEGLRLANANGTPATPTVVHVLKPNVDLAPPLATPRLSSSSQAVQVAAQTFGAWVAEKPHGTEYGSFTDNAYRRSVEENGQRLLEPVGTRDVWKVTVTGVSIPVPGGMGGAETAVQIAPLSTFVIFIDGESGKYLEATGH